MIVAALISFFPVLVFTTTGLRSTPAGSDDMFVVFGARRWQRFRHLAVPSAVPRLLVALRLSVVAAVVGAMLAQWIMGTSGLGYRLVVAQVSFRTSEAWGASFVAILLSVALYSAVSALCRVAQSRFE
jgi:NitT/TauT family transport system permease protein